MIQYIVAAGVGAFLGNRSRKSKMAHGGKTQGYNAFDYLYDYATFRQASPFDTDNAFAVKIVDDESGRTDSETIWAESEESIREDLSKIMTDSQAIEGIVKVDLFERGGKTGMSQLKAAELFEMQMTSVSKALDRADLELSRTGNFENAFSAVAQARDHAMYMRRFATFMGAPRSLKGLIDALRDNLDQLQRDIKVGLKVEGYNTERPLVGISAAQRRLADIQALFMETTQEALRNEDN